MPATARPAQNAARISLLKGVRLIRIAAASAL
jgi:hypothetical protein